MSAAAKITAALRQYGRAMTLRRRVGTSAAFAEVVVQGVAREYRPHELVGGLQQGDQQVTVSNAEIAAQSAYAGPPRKGDQILIDGRAWTLQGCETKYLGTTVLAHVLWCRGG